jgi:glycosyltransferase involved in cell wall biosynthesis
MMPDYRPQWVIETLYAKSGVLHPGCDFPTDVQLSARPDDQPPLVVWNHRWEFDKDPETFFAALDAVARQGIAFRLALLGENFQVVPKAFIAARQRFHGQIVCCGYEPSRQRYIDWLKQGALVVSTATQENFGISIVEAVRHGCLPLVPKRLSYPEIIPEPWHADFLYHNQQDLIAKLSHFLKSDQAAYAPQRQCLSRAMGIYAWENLIPDYDRELEHLAGLTG